MRYLFYFLLISISAITLAEDAPENIDAFRWSHRKILVKTSSNNSEYISQLQSSRDEIIDRDILWFLFLGTEMESNYQGSIDPSFNKTIFNKYLDSNTEAVILIGKDGGIKSSAAVLDLAVIFDQIDLMPMRRAEIEEARQ